MTTLNPAQRISIVRGHLAQHEADAFQAELRADAMLASGNTDQAEQETDQHEKSLQRAAAMQKRLDQEIASAESDGYEVEIAPDNSVKLSRPQDKDNGSTN